MLSVAIIGPGAVGTTIAYELQQSLPHTTLIGRHAKTITYYTVPHAPAQDIVVKVMKMSQTHLMLLLLRSKHINLMPLFLI